jgi:hypothetical protein
MNSSSTSGNRPDPINDITNIFQHMIRDLDTKSENVFFLKQIDISESLEFFIQKYPNLLYLRFPKKKDVKVGNIENFIKFQHPDYHQKQVVNHDSEKQQNIYFDVYNINDYDIYFKLFQLNFTVPDTMIGKREETEFLFQIIFFCKPVFLTIPYSIYEYYDRDLSEYYDVIVEDQNKQKLNQTTKSSNPHNSLNSNQYQKFTSHSNNRIKNNNNTVKLKLRVFTVIKNEKIEIDDNNLRLLNSNLSNVQGGIKTLEIPVEYIHFFDDLLLKYTFKKQHNNINTYDLKE